MSYSFSIQSKSKAEAKTAVKEKLAEIALAQPPHKFDQSAANVVADAYIDFLRDVEAGETLYVIMSGSIGWRGAYEDPKDFTSAQVNVSARIGTS
jgi:hypothetical protein